MRILLVLLALALPAHAQDRPITAAEFEQMVTGQTLSYQSSGGEYGAEEYLDNRRVRWSFLDGECTEGVWYEKGPQICFEYEDIEGEQCWQFYERNGKLLARFENDPTQTELIETRRRSGPLYCVGPEVGA
ncbi:hypothetical protein N9L47_02805 [Rhodobacteraceae bacterium]|nr:hypothetical protein [Paracoccaceae bacterium]